MASPVPVALINNSVTPYRLHLHSRLAREIPELQFWSVFTHEVSNSPWRLKTPPEIRPVFFGPGEESLQSDSVRRQWGEWRKAKAILAWIRQRQIRAVVLGGYSDAGLLRILLWCHRRHLPCFLFGDSNIHCDGSSVWKGALKAAFLPQVLRRCTGVLCCGRFGEQYFSRYGVPTGKIFRFPYEPDYGRIRSLPTGQIEAIRKTYHLAPERRYLIYSGRLISLKRVNLLLRAFARIAPVRPDWDLIVAGDGEQRSVLQALIPSGISQRAIWTGFINDPENLAALYGAAHVLVLPSDYEPWGVVVTEAAVRMPVVASSVVGAAADVIVDGLNGRIFQAGELDSLERCLLDVTNPARLAAMTAAAPAQFAAWHSDSDPVVGLRAAFSSMELA